MKAKTTKQKGKNTTKSAFDAALFHLGIHFPAQETVRAINESSANH